MKDSEKIRLLGELKDILRNKQEYVEGNSILEQYVGNIDDEVFLINTSIFDIACMLHDSDMRLPMEPNIYRFCMEVYLDEVSKNNADAANNIGSLFYSGRGGEQDYKRAVEFYTMAASLGSIDACENLGYCYYYGRIGEPDYEKAFKNYLKAALSGKTISMYKIGDMFKNGYYVEKDEKLAFSIYCSCLDKVTNSPDDCSADVFFRVANCLYKGIGTNIDLYEALKFYQMAETNFYFRVERGDNMIRGVLSSVIKEEEEVRKLIKDTLSLR